MNHADPNNFNSTCAGSQPACPAISLRFPARIEHGHIVLPPDFAASGAGEGSALLVIVKTIPILDTDWGRGLLRRDRLPVASAGTTLYTLRRGISHKPDPEKEKFLRAYSDAIRASLGVRQPKENEHPDHLCEIHLLEDLYVSIRERGTTRLCPCRCRVGWLEKQFSSLNLALSAIIRETEPNRASGTGNAHHEIIAPFFGDPKNSDAWSTLGEFITRLRMKSPANAGAGEQLVLPIHIEEAAS